METQLHDLQNRPLPAAPAAPALDGKAIDALSARVGKIEQALAKLPAGDPATAERLAAAENAMKALGVTLAALNRRVDDIDGNAKQALAHADEAEKAVAALQTASKAAANAPAPALRDDIEALDKRIAALEQAAQAARAHIAENSGIDKAARLALSAAVLRDAVVQGLSFTAELAAVKSLGAGDKTLTALAPFAAAGVPGDKALAHELGALIPAMLKAAGAPAPPKSFLGRLQANADKLVRIRPVGAPPGNDPADVIARIEIDAANANIPAALADLAKLPDPARAPAAAWIEKVKARQAALAAARQLAADAGRELGHK